MRFIKESKGITFVEILVILGIIVALTAIVVPAALRFANNDEAKPTPTPTFAFAPVVPSLPDGNVPPTPGTVQTVRTNRSVLQEALASVIGTEKTSQKAAAAAGESEFNQEAALAWELYQNVSSPWGWELITPISPLSPFYTVEVQKGVVVVRLSSNSSTAYFFGGGASSVEKKTTVLQ